MIGFVHERRNGAFHYPNVSPHVSFSRPTSSRQGCEGRGRKGGEDEGEKAAEILVSFGLVSNHAPHVEHLYLTSVKDTPVLPRPELLQEPPRLLVVHLIGWRILDDEESKISIMKSTRREIKEVVSSKLKKLQNV